MDKKVLRLPWDFTKSTMALTSGSEWALGPWYVWEHGLLLAPVPIVKKRLHIIGMYSINTSEPRYPKQNYISPPKPISQFLLGSTPTQLEPGFGFLVLRHMRSLTNQPTNWITQRKRDNLIKIEISFQCEVFQASDSRCCGCMRNHQDWRWSPRKYHSC